MNHAKTLLVSLGAATLSLGFSLQPHPAPFWETNIVIAGEESVPKGNVKSDEDSSGAKSAKMGKHQSSHSPENDTQKVEQPPRQNPTTGN
jgi:hypothetical protein